MTNKAVNPELFDIIRTPVITEKSSMNSGKVTFKVHPDSTKTQIRKAVEAVFGVKVLSVNVINNKGKVKRFRGKLGKRNDTKKAIITLAEGQSVDIASGV